MFNWQYSNFLAKVKSLKHDPLIPDMPLDYFNQYHMQVNNYFFEKTLEKIVIRDYGDENISALHLGMQMRSYFDEIEVIELQDILEDERLNIAHMKENAFEDYLIDHSE